MSEISLDAAQLERLFADLQPKVDDVYDALRNIPDVDGGIASNMIAMITSTAAEASQILADSYVAMMALTREVINDFAATEESAAQDFRDYEVEIEES